MFKTVNEVDEETVTKENDILLKRDLTDSLLSGNVDHSYEINHSLMIEGDVKKNNPLDN